MAKISLEMQIAALELTISNRKGFVENLRQLVASHKRQPIELDIAAKPIPGLEAALATLKWVKANESTIKKAFGRQDGA